MDGLSGAASVIAVIDMSAKITALCFQYSFAVKDAKSDIERIGKKVSNIKHVLESIKKLLDGLHKARLSTTHGLFKSLKQYLLELQRLEEKLEPSKTSRTMSKFGMDLILGFDQKLDLVAQDAYILHRKLVLTALPAAEGASYDSHAEEHKGRCLSNTRTKLLDEITTWANDKEGKSIFWLSGMAGTRKSTIARTIAQSFADRRQLGASFFFKKGEGERGNASRFFTTIASDLAKHEPGIGTYLPTYRATYATPNFQALPSPPI